MVWIFGIGVFLLLIFAFPKQMGMLFLLLIGGGIAIYLVAQERQLRDGREIEMSASGNKAICADPQYPIAVSFKNVSSSRTLNSLSFSIRGYREKYSSPVSTVGYVSSDRIIPPGQTYTACWSLGSYNKLPAGEAVETLTWQVEKHSTQWR